MIIRENFGELSDKATQQLIAPVFLTLYASVPLSTGDLFIFDNKLYKATTDIAQDAQITIGSGGNAVDASSVSDELQARNFAGIDFDNIVHTFTAGTGSTSTLDVDTWVATEDCILAGFLTYNNSMGATPADIYVENICLCQAWVSGASSWMSFGTLLIKAGQTVRVRNYHGQLGNIKAYGLLR